MNPTVHVAVGVLEDEQGRVLIARRPEHVHQGGLWEFPGGKVDPGETLTQALQRELWEELAIRVLTTQPLIRIPHHYTDKSVLLDVHKVTRFEGQPRGNEGQPVQWVSPHQFTQYQFPAANVPIVSALNLPDRMLITGAAPTMGEFLDKAEKALLEGVRLLQLRCPGLAERDYAALARLLAELCHQYGATLMCNTTVEHWRKLQLGGLHLNSMQLAACTERPVPVSVRLGASCHTSEEIERACALGVDYLALSPVAATASHPGVSPLGWERFAELVEQARVPVYALGGMTLAEISLARRLGAQGIAGIRFGWGSQ
jgi:8-oxo-dGTP diphosphatase